MVADKVNGAAVSETAVRATHVIMVNALGAVEQGAVVVDDAGENLSFGFFDMQCTDRREKVAKVAMVAISRECICAKAKITG
ncbi:MAG: hypothetical protein K0U66_08005 [Gammaproteobacteria bacterium]|nr:hypothetical protein [Gammaproteobacteria bacterium]